MCSAACILTGLNPWRPPSAALFIIYLSFFSHHPRLRLRPPCQAETQHVHGAHARPFTVLRACGTRPADAGLDALTYTYSPGGRACLPSHVPPPLPGSTTSTPANELPAPEEGCEDTLHCMKVRQQQTTPQDDNNNNNSGGAGNIVEIYNIYLKIEAGIL